MLHQSIIVPRVTPFEYAVSRKIIIKCINICSDSTCNSTEYQIPPDIAKGSTDFEFPFNELPKETHFTVCSHFTSKPIGWKHFI